MKILVTGAAGQVGSYLVEMLSEKHEVRGIDLRKSGIDNVDKSIEIGDIKEYQFMMSQTRECDAVVHVAAQVSVERSLTDPIFDAAENIMGTLNVLETSAKTLVPQVVYISSAAIFGEPVRVPIDESHPTNPKSPYGVSKLAAENYLFVFQECYGMNVTSIRPFNIYSQRQDPDSPYSGVITRFIDLVKDGKEPMIEGDGLQTRDFVSVHDVNQMIELCLGDEKAHGQRFNCGTGKPTTIKALAELIIELSGKNLEPITRPARPGDIRDSHADISKAKDVLGYEPKVSLNDGLAELFD